MKLREVKENYGNKNNSDIQVSCGLRRTSLCLQFWRPNLARYCIVQDTALYRMPGYRNETIDLFSSFCKVTSWQTILNLECLCYLLNKKKTVPFAAISLPGSMVGILLPGVKVLDLRKILSYTSFPVKQTF